MGQDTISRLRVLRCTRLATVLCCMVVGACAADPGFGGRTSAEWIAQLGADNPREREDAALALGRVLERNPRLRAPVEALVRALADTADAVRLAASRALRQPGIRATDAVSGLEGMLQDSAHAEVRVHALRTLAALLPHVRDSATRIRIVGQLSALHRDTSPSVRVAAAMAWARDSSGSIGRAEVQTSLTELARDATEEARREAIAALAMAGTPSTLDVVRRALEDSSRSVRAAAVAGLSRAGAAARYAIPELVRALSDTAAGVRFAAVKALDKLAVPRSPAVNAAFRVAAQDADSTVRQEAVHALATFHARGGTHSPREPTQAERCRDLPPRTRGC